MSYSPHTGWALIEPRMQHLLISAEIDCIPPQVIRHLSSYSIPRGPSPFPHQRPSFHNHTIQQQLCYGSGTMPLNCSAPSMGVTHFTRLSVYSSASGFSSFNIWMSSNIPARTTVNSLGSPSGFILRPKSGAPIIFVSGCPSQMQSYDTDHNLDRNNSSYDSHCPMFLPLLSDFQRYPVLHF